MEWEFHLSDSTLEWIKENCFYLVALDFSGYLFTPFTDMKIACGLGSDGLLIFYSIDLKKPNLSDRKYAKIINRMIKKGYLRCTSFDPFPEYEEYNNIKAPTDESKIKYIPSPLFHGQVE